MQTLVIKDLLVVGGGLELVLWLCLFLVLLLQLLWWRWRRGRFLVQQLLLMLLHMTLRTLRTVQAICGPLAAMGPCPGCVEF